MKLKILIILLLGLMLPAQLFSMTMTIKQKPAIVLAAFGTTTKARATFDQIDQQIRKHPVLGNYTIKWAFTSEVIRERANKAFKKRGEKTRYLSLLQVLSNLEAVGYRKIVVQPLHIFPGQEFQEVERIVAAFEGLGLRIELGETLLHEWPYVYETIDILERDFLSRQEGCNVIVAHGTPKSFVGSNSTYMGLDRYLTLKYDHVFIGAVDGVLTREQVLAKAKNCQQKKVRFIPYMLVAGDHIMNDIMSPEPDNEGTPSWATEMQAAGFSVDSLKVSVAGDDLFKGLGFNENIVKMYLRFIEESLKKLQTH